MGVREGQEHAVPTRLQSPQYTLRLTQRQRDHLLWLIESYLDGVDLKPAWRLACHEVYRNLYHCRADGDARG